MNNLITPYKIGLVYLFEHISKYGKVLSSEVIENLIPDAGLDYIVSAAMAGGAQFSTWYLGLSETSYTPIAGETMVSILTNAPECKKYDEAARVELSPGAVASGLYSNTASPAVFTFNAAASVKVGFLSTVSVWDNTSGLLISAVEFPSPKVITEAGELLRVTAGVQLTAV